MSFPIGNNANSALQNFGLGVGGEEFGTGLVVNSAGTRLRLTQWVDLFGNFPTSVVTFGAIADGVTHPLSSVTSYLGVPTSGWTLAQWRAVFPFATALSNELNWCAFSTARGLTALNGSVSVPATGSTFYGYDQFAITQGPALVVWQLNGMVEPGTSNMVTAIGSDLVENTSAAGVFFSALTGFSTATATPTARSLANWFADVPNVKAFGAALDGTTDDTAAIAAAYAAVNNFGSLYVPSGAWDATAPTFTAGKSVLWKLDKVTNGAGNLNNVVNGDVVEWYPGRKAFWRTVTDVTQPFFATAEGYLNINAAGGTFANVASALRATTIVGASTNHLFPWGLNSTVTTSAVGDTIDTGPQTVGVAGTTTRIAGNAPLWALFGQSVDTTGLSSATGGHMNGLEIDVTANGADDGNAGVGTRQLAQFAYVKYGSGSAVDVRLGLYVGPQNGTVASGRIGIGMQVLGNVYRAAFDASQIVPADSTVAAYRMGPDQVIDFSGNSVGLGSNLNVRTLGWVSADTALEYKVSGTARFRINDGGGIQSTLATGNQGSALALTYPGGTTAVFTPKIAFSGSLSGQIVGGPAAVGVTSWTINSDSLDTTTGAGAPKGINDFYIGHNISAGATGGRNGVNVFLNQTGATTLAAGQFYVGVASNVVASFNAGGVSGTPAGAVMGFNPRAVLQSGATFFNSAVGMEVDFGARVGSSLSYKYGLTIVLDQLDAVDASVNSAGLVFGLNASAGPTSPGLLFGVQYGGPQNWWPINPTLGTLIGVAQPINGSGPAYTALNGVDISAVTFSGAAFKSTGFSVDGTGLIVGNTKASGATTSRTLASQAADLYNAKNFGAAGNGSTVDLTALINACAPIGNVFLPATTTSYYIGESIYAGHASNQRFAGGFSGGLISSLESSVQTQQARNLARFYVAPTAPGATLWTGNFSGVHLPLQTIIAGASTLTKPTTAYYNSRVTSAIVGDMTNSSGWQEQVLGNGRTGASFMSVSMSQAGMGDFIGINFSGTVSGQNTTPPVNALGLPVLGFANGTLAGAASSTYIDLIEFQLADNNFDMQVSAGTYNFYRQNNTAAIGQGWWGTKYTSFNKPVDAAITVGGSFRTAIDLTTGRYYQTDGTTPSNAAMLMGVGQGTFGNAVNTSRLQLPGQTVPGNEWFGWRGHYGWTMTAGAFSTVILNVHEYGARASNLGTAGALGSNAATSGVTLQTRDGIVAKTAVVNTITPTSGGGSYLTIPTLVVAAPPGSGTQATAAVATMKLVFKSAVAAGGTLYTKGDVLTLSGGTAGTAAQVTVTDVDAITGAAMGFTVTTAGSYTVPPTSPISTTGGAGTGCTLTGHWGVLTATVTNAGSNYPEFPPPDVTTTGGTPDDQQMAAFTTTMTATQQPLTIGAGANVALMAAGSYGGGTGVVFIANDSVDPISNPTGGGILYVSAGALKYRGSGGTVTVLGPA